MVLIEIPNLQVWNTIIELHPHSLILFDASWLKLKHGIGYMNDTLSLANTKIYNVYYLCSNGSDEIEDYLVNVLSITFFPCFCLFENNRLIIANDVSTTKSNSSSSSSINGSIHLSNLSLISRYDAAIRVNPVKYYKDKVIHCLFNNSSNSSSVGDVNIGKLYISGDKASVGKSTIAMLLIASLIKLGVCVSDIAYIKPITQCEKEQPVGRYCTRMGIKHQSIGPIVFYKGYTRAFLNGETEDSCILLQQVQKAVNDISVGRKLTIVDGVGYPSVGSICGISNADTAKAINAPVLLVGKSGVGDAIDSYNLNAQFFKSYDVTVLGGVFNKLELDGFYSLDVCKAAIVSYFNQYKSSETPYGFMPIVKDCNIDEDIDAYTDLFLSHVDLISIVYETWMHHLLNNYKQSIIVCQQQQQAGSTKTHANVMDVDMNHNHINGSRINPYNHNIVLPPHHLNTIATVNTAANGLTPSVICISSKKRERAEIEAASIQQGAKVSGG